jgi:5-bromo-4-chloroindolyl phosphate hydrolysis protein
MPFFKIPTKAKMNKADDIILKLTNFEDKLLGEYYADDEYREMLFTVGLTERDYSILQSALNDYISRSKQFLKRGLNDDALKQLKSAQIISPNNYEVNIGLASCYFTFWQKTRENSFKKLSEKHTQFCLNLKPNDNIAADLLEMIRSGKGKTEKIKNQNSGRMLSNFLSWLMVKDQKGEYSRLYIAIFILLISGVLFFYVIPVSIMDNISANEAQKLSVELEKKYELINKYILDKEIDKAQNELLNLVHPSKEYTEIYPKGFSLEPYSYNGYWKMKREELGRKIESLKKEKKQN